MRRAENSHAKREDEEGEAVDVRVRLPLEMRRDVSQIGNLKNVGELATLIQSLQPANLKD